MANTPFPSHETSSDIDDVLAAEGQVGVDKETLPKRVIRKISAGDNALDPMSQWYIPAVEKGDLYLKGAAHPVIHAPDKLLFTPILSRTFYKLIGPSSAKPGNIVKGVFRREPKGTVYVPKMGRRSPNGDLVLKCGELYALIDGVAWLLEAAGMDCKTLAAVNEHVDGSWWTDAKGEHHRCALYTTKCAAWTVTDADDRGNEYVNLKLGLVGVYREPAGPTRDEVMLARDLHNELKKTLQPFPDPDVIPLDTRRVVNAPALVEPSLDDGGGYEAGDPGWTPPAEGDDIPF